jgi:hypothetical protein
MLVIIQFHFKMHCSYSINNHVKQLNFEITRVVVALHGLPVLACFSFSECTVFLGCRIHTA